MKCRYTATHATQQRTLRERLCRGLGVHAVFKSSEGEGLDLQLGHGLMRSSLSLMLDPALPHAVYPYEFSELIATDADVSY